MKTIEEIKIKCRAVIEQAEKVTPGPWHYWNQPSNDVVATGEKKGVLICGLAGLVSRPDDFAFIARSRSFTPAAAKALLDVIDALERIAKTKFGWEGDCGVIAIAENQLEAIRENWDTP